MIKTVRALSKGFLAILLLIQFPKAYACTNPPTAPISPSGSVSICQGTSSTLHTNSAAGLTYQWKKNGVNIVTNGNDSTLLVTTAGSYTVDVSAGAGCTTTSLATTVNVNPLPPTTISIQGYLNFCLGSNVALCQPSGAGFTYQWKDAFGNIPGATSACYYTNVGGSFKVIIINNTTGCTDSSISTVVTPGFGPPAVIFPLSVETCLGTPATLHTNNAPGYTYQWMLNGVNITSGGNDSVYNATVTGFYSVSVAAVGGGCVATSNQAQVSVHALPQAHVLIHDAPCYNNCNGYINWISGGNTYALNNGAYSNSYIYSGLCAGAYTFHIKDYFGCIKDTVLTITQPSPLSSVASLVVPIVCNNQGTVSLTASGGTPPYKYSHGVNGSYNTSSVFTNLAPGIHTFSIVDSAGCLTSDTITLTALFSPPTPNVTHVSGLLSTSAYPSYQWNLNGIAINGATLQYFTPTAGGLYTVSVVDVNGCNGTSIPVNIPALGISNYNAGKDISIYPNPTHRIIHVQATSAVSARLTDLQGRQIVMQDNCKQIDVSSLADGLYILTLRDTLGKVIHISRVAKFAP